MELGDGLMEGFGCILGVEVILEQSFMVCLAITIVSAN